MDTGNLKERFLTFAETECKGNSELYYWLSFKIANDAELLNIAANAREGQPIPNIFFAAIHYLLLKNQNNELAKYYLLFKKVILQKFLLKSLRSSAYQTEMK